MEIYLGNEDSISQSEFQFLLEQQKIQKENEKAENEETNDENTKEEKEEKIEEKPKEESSSESVDAPVNPVKIMRAKYIDIAAIFLLILTVCYLYWYGSVNTQI